jgi:hypothetical protein
VKIQVNHTIGWCVDRHRSSAFLAELLARPAPTEYGPFKVVELDNNVSLDFLEAQEPIASQHYACLVDDEAFTLKTPMDTCSRRLLGGMGAVEKHPVKATVSA